MLYLVFSTESECDAAESTISGNMGCSIVGRNAFTGELEPDKQQTVRWAIPYQRITDGKWIIPKPDAGYMSGVVDYAEEEHDSSWFPQEDL